MNIPAILYAALVGTGVVILFVGAFLGLLKFTQFLSDKYYDKFSK